MLMETMMIKSVWGEEKKILHLLDHLCCKYHFREEDCLDLKTAVSEACLNAIEHGNQLLPQLHVEVSVTVIDDTVTVDVCDQGHGSDISLPSRKEVQFKPSDDDDSDRGWGLLMIEQLVDEWTLFCKTDNRTYVTQVKKKMNSKEEGR